MPTTPTPKPDPEDLTPEGLVKRSTKKSKVPERLDDLATAHVVANVLAAGDPKKKKPPKGKRGK